RRPFPVHWYALRPGMVTAFHDHGISRTHRQKYSVISMEGGYARGSGGGPRGQQGSVIMKGVAWGRPRRRPGPAWATAWSACGGSAALGPGGPRGARALRAWGGAPGI